MSTISQFISSKKQPNILLQNMLNIDGITDNMLLSLDQYASDDSSDCDDSKYILTTTQKNIINKQIQSDNKIIEFIQDDENNDIINDLCLLITEDETNITTRIVDTKTY